MQIVYVKNRSLKLAKNHPASTVKMFAGMAHCQTKYARQIRSFNTKSSANNRTKIAFACTPKSQNYNSNHVGWQSQACK